MGLNNKRKKYVRIVRETESHEAFALLDEVNSNLKDDIDNVMNDSFSEFVLEEILENELDSDDEPLKLLANPTIEKKLEESSIKTEKEVKGQSNRKGKGKKR